MNEATELTAANSLRFSLEQPEGSRVSPDAIRLIEANGGQVEMVSAGAMIVFRMPKAMPLFARLAAQSRIVRGCQCPMGTTLTECGEPTF